MSMPVVTCQVTDSLQSSHTLQQKWHFIWTVKKLPLKLCHNNGTTVISLFNLYCTKMFLAVVVIIMKKKVSKLSVCIVYCHSNVLSVQLS